MQEHDERDEDEGFAEAALIQAIENQLESGDPATAQAVYNKLTLVGHEREDTLRLMALVLAWEIRQMMREQRPFDRERYEQALRALPELPEDDDKSDLAEMPDQ
ncbi:hypothetical protein [Azomonas macrocytogenes]|uniref:DUF1841 family protein n=1 Tax=Azomonas macrocytogenes TaxID=69962 RepID=A0A839T7V5_AZOMA|nr:hypothetical protein [Azomonas macrocytogenes]MBB3104334.1 hypothetical protein [Azomonas macrocytogenes]